MICDADVCPAFQASLFCGPAVAGARGRDKGREPLTKEALDADLDAVSFLLFLGVFLSAYFNIKWILGAFNHWPTV